ncbi:MAG: ATP synthase F1 subunit epsilon [bacterium]
MSEKSFQCRINTPDDTVFEGSVESLVLPGENGSFGILYNHTPLMALLGPGEIKMEDSGSSRKLACGGGFAEVRDNNVRILAETAEFPEDLDREEVESKIEEINEQLESKDPNMDNHEREELQENLRRQQVRLKVLNED